MRDEQGEEITQVVETARIICQAIHDENVDVSHRLRLHP
jgi:hypothetical protein